MAKQQKVKIPAPSAEDEAQKLAEAERQKLKGPLLKSLIDTRRAHAWQLHSWPMVSGLTQVLPPS
jgi:hypothetical protein